MLLLTISSLLASCLASSLNPELEFARFKADHGKSYASLAEEEVRFAQFKANLDKIEKHNAEGHSWKLGITKFADLSKYVNKDENKGSMGKSLLKLFLLPEICPC